MGSLFSIKMDTYRVPDFQTVAVKNGTDAWDRWIELPLPMKFKVMIFDIQNPQGITDGEEPIYIEVRTLYQTVAGVHSTAY